MTPQTNATLYHNLADTLIGLAPNTDTLNTSLEALATLVTLFDKDTEASRFFCSPLTSTNAKRDALETLCKAGLFPEYARRFLDVLANQNLLYTLPEILKSARKIRDQQSGNTHISVTSAAPLNPSDLGSLKALFTQHLKRKCLLEETVDSSLIGGLTVAWDNYRLDLSLKSELNQLKRSLIGARVCP